MNWYAYVGNDPVNQIDPSGEAHEWSYLNRPRGVSISKNRNAMYNAINNTSKEDINKLSGMIGSNATLGAIYCTAFCPHLVPPLAAIGTTSTIISVITSNDPLTDGARELATAGLGSKMDVVSGAIKSVTKNDAVIDTATAVTKKLTSDAIKPESNNENSGGIPVVRVSGRVESKKFDQ